MSPNSKLSVRAHVAYLAPRLIEDLRKADGAVECAVGTWIAYCVLNHEAFDVDYIDTGYDCSSHLRRSGTLLRALSLSLQTVEQFLELPTGQTVATYVSGSGFGGGDIRGRTRRLRRRRTP
jgi:hypothetical protein